jgi:hypothetical protein
VQHPQLLQAFELLDRGPREVRNLQEKLPAIGVQTQVLMKMRWLGSAASRSSCQVRACGITDRLKYSARPAASKTTFTHDWSCSFSLVRIGVLSVDMTAVGFRSSSSTT